jgi:hypothetical protein
MEIPIGPVMRMFIFLLYSFGWVGLRGLIHFVEKTRNLALTHLTNFNSWQEINMEGYVIYVFPVVRHGHYASFGYTLLETYAEFFCNRGQLDFSSNDLHICTSSIQPLIKSDQARNLKKRRCNL